MCSKDEAEKIIMENLNIERLKKIIVKTSIVAWDNIISEKNIDEWLENFTGKYFPSVEAEKKIALWLLAHFTYYTNNDVRILCKVLFNLLLHQKLVENGNSTPVDDILNELLTESVFVGLGNASESGHHILYYFRQENKMSKTCFKPQPGKKYKNLILIDDVSMTGSQACDYVALTKIDAENIYAGFLIATEKAVNTIKLKNPKIHPIATMILDQRECAFSSDSFVFSNPKVKNIREHAMEFCKLYGQIAVDNDDYMTHYPLGFGDGGYLLGFEYNTPDNTLPILWETCNGWKPLFIRYAKIYSLGKENAIDGRKFY